MLKNHHPNPGKFKMRYDGLFTVVRKLSDVNYEIRKDGANVSQIVHVNRLKPYRGQEKYSPIVIRPLRKKKKTLINRRRPTHRKISDKVDLHNSIAGMNKDSSILSDMTVQPTVRLTRLPEGITSTVHLTKQSEKWKNDPKLGMRPVVRLTPLTALPEVTETKGRPVDIQLETPPHERENDINNPFNHPEQQPVAEERVHEQRDSGYNLRRRH